LAVLRWWLLGAFLALVVARLALAQLSPPGGFAASYLAGLTPNGGGAAASSAPERSTEFLTLRGATRVDATLDFRGDAFPVYFFNDVARFNFGPDTQPGRDQLPFSVRWTGALQVASNGARRFALDANGPARVLLDDTELLSAAGEAQRDLAAGTHALQVEYTRLEASVPRLRLSWQSHPGGELEVVRSQPDPWRLALDMAVVVTGVATLGAWIVHLRKRAWLVALPVLFLAYGAALQAPLLGRATILSGLDDWLVYESSARDILLNGLLMNGGQQHAAPFYGQPLYPYVLALAHLLTGEGLFGPLALQFAALGLLVVLSFVLARRAFDSQLAGYTSLAGLWLFMAVQNEYVRVARQLFNENLYMPLVMLTLIALVSLLRGQSGQPRWYALLLVGVLLGVTSISRSQFLAFVPLALLILAVAWRRPLPLVLIVAGLLLAVAPVTARNWIVSGELVPISASGGASLLEFHRPPPGLIDQTGLQRDPLFEALHLDTSTRTVVAFARADPLGYLRTWLPLGAHSLGLPGRNPASGVYWPLLIVVVLYVAALALPRARRRRVWPIHAFVAGHMLVLMLFEADTYGYRLVMPMYAPMLVVAAQLPLALIQRTPRVRARPAYLPAAAALAALLVQGKALLDAWPDRDTSLVGLGGGAAHAAATAERVGADAIYVASVDGTPRRYGAGALPGLRYPWFKWFDPTRSLPLPARGATAVYALGEIADKHVAGDLVACLGTPDASGERVLTGEQARGRCTTQLPPLQATFEGLAKVEALEAPTTAQAGETVETRLLWEPLKSHPQPHVVWLHLEDADTQWGNATLDPYPAAEWQPGEALLSRLLLQTDQTAIPDHYQLTLGMSPATGNAPPVTALWQGGKADQVPVGTVALEGATTDMAMLELPRDMLPVHGVAGGGLELLAARRPAPEAAAGAKVRLGLLWRAVDDAPQASQYTVKLVREGGEVVQQTQLPLLGGRLKPGAFHAGQVMREEAAFEIGPRVSVGLLGIEVGLGDAQQSARIGDIEVTGREHILDSSGDKPVAVFGQRIALLGATLEPAQVRPGGKLTVHVRWRAEAPIDRSYKVFVHVLDAALRNVVAQRDAEPRNGQAPTTSWVPGELIEDELELSAPNGVPQGEYPIEVGVYEERSGERLALPNGDSRVVLDTRLQVR
jgi:4-amino-4-deoxy-L-arabinose transferase-like glycosyltransferase